MAPVDSLLWAHDEQWARGLCQALPKVELHRHLTGSLPSADVRRVLERVCPELAPDAMLQTPQHEASAAGQAEAWVVLERQCEAVRVASEASVSDFLKLVRAAVIELQRDNVFYCEFRVGLKRTPTKRAYVMLEHVRMTSGRGAMITLI